MKNYLLIIIALGLSVPALAQRTKGGSTQSWRRYDVQYDTTYQAVTENVRYPSTSRTYFRVGIVNGRGLWTEESLTYYPENGFKGTDGGDMAGGWEIVIGGWTNMTESNKNLHPAVDLSLINEFGLHVYNYEYNGDVADYSVDYGTTYDIDYALGVGATIKPGLFSGSTTPPSSNGVLIDVGATVGLNLFGIGETTYQSGNSEGDLYYDEDLIGMRLNLNLQIGIRYGFVGAYVCFGQDMADIYAPTYQHDYNGSDFESFEEDVAYNTTSFGLSLNF